MKFKVGDTVRILEGTKMLGWSKLAMSRWCGEIGIINEIGHMPEYQVQFEEGEKWCFNEEDLESVKEVMDLRELIKPCYAVRIRDGRWLIAFMRKDGGVNLNRIDDVSHGVTKVSSFDENLLDSDSVSCYDIMEIRGFTNTNQYDIKNREIIWERIEKSPTQIKLEELEKQQREIADKIAELRKEIK